MLQDEGVDIFSGKDITAEVVFEQNEEASLMANEGKAAFLVEKTVQSPQVEHV